MLIADDGIVSGPDDPDRQNAQLSNMFASGGGMSADTMKSVGASAQGLISAAKSGGFKMTPNGVKPMRDAIADMLGKLDTRISKAEVLTQPPKLGSSEYAKAVSQHDVKGGKSARDSLMDFQAVLLDCDEALARAAGIYKETDEANKDTFSGGSFTPDSSSGNSPSRGSFRAV